MITERISYKIKMNDGSVLFALLDVEKLEWTVTRNAGKDLYRVGVMTAVTAGHACERALAFWKYEKKINQ